MRCDECSNQVLGVCYYCYLYITEAELTQKLQIIKKTICSRLVVLFGHETKKNLSLKIHVISGKSVDRYNKAKKPL